MCANSSKQGRGIDFDHSWSSIIGAGTYRMTIMYTDVFRLMLAVIGMVNCIQNTRQEEHERLVIIWLLLIKAIQTVKQ